MAKRTQQVSPVSWPNEANGNRPMSWPNELNGNRPVHWQNEPNGHRPASWQNEPNGNRPMSWQNEANRLLAHGSRLFARKRALGRDTSLRATFLCRGRGRGDCSAKRANGDRLATGRTKPTGTIRCFGRTKPMSGQRLRRTKPTANRPVYWQNEPNPLLAHGSRLFARKRALGRDTSLRSTFPLPRPRTRRLFGRTKPTGIAWCFGRTKPMGAASVLAERTRHEAGCGIHFPSKSNSVRGDPFRIQA